MNMNMTEILAPSRPWLDLFRTDFVSLRLSHSRFVEAPPEPTSPDDAPIKQGSTRNPSSSTNSTSLNVLPLPSEVLHAIFSRLDPEDLSSSAQVCQKWLCHAYEPHLWQRVAQRTWPFESPKTLENLLYRYKSYRKLCTLRPRLRTNSIYVSRHQYAKTASRSATSAPSTPVFLVTYHRFLRFYSDGVVVSLTTPEPPDVAYKRVRRNLKPTNVFDRDKAAPSIGTYEFHTDRLEVRVTLPMRQPKFPAMRSGTLYMTFSLSGTKEGSFNRLIMIEHYAIMDANNDEGDLISYRADNYAGRAFRLVRLVGFKWRVLREFPSDDQRDLAQWAEMKRASRKAAHRALERRDN